ALAVIDPVNRGVAPCVDETSRGRIRAIAAGQERRAHPATAQLVLFTELAAALRAEQDDVVGSHRDELVRLRLPVPEAGEERRRGGRARRAIPAPAPPRRPAAQTA